MMMGAGPLTKWVGSRRIRTSSIIEEAVAGLPFKNRIAVGTVASSLPAKVDFAICVPARNEEHILPASLASLIDTVERSGAVGAIVLLINNSADRSWQVASSMLEASGCNYLLVKVSLRPAVADAPHARRIALDIGALLVPDGALLTTDADTLVAPNWAAANLRHIRDGTDLVCGSVSIDPQEYTGLPHSVRRCGKVEAAYSAELEQLWQRWTGGDAPSFQIAAMGASLALPTARYRGIGGMPIPPVAEDKALAILARRRDWSIKVASDVTASTSGRLFGRAAGGMGDALRDRATHDDPYCDEQLVPLALLQRLADVWNGLQFGMGRYAQFQDAIARDPALQHRRMRMSQVMVNLSNARKETLDDTTSALRAAGVRA